MASNDKQYRSRPLTPKERQFVRLLMEGHGKSAAYRLAYGTNADSHTVSAMACALAKKPKVKSALTLAENGNWAGLISCGLDVDFVNWKKLTALGHDPAVPGYAQVKALLAARQYRDRLDLRAKENAMAAQRATSEEIERLLLNGIGPELTEDETDDDFSLDDPLPAPGEASSTCYAQQQPLLARDRFKFRTGPDDPTLDEHPFLAKRVRRPSF